METTLRAIYIALQAAPVIALLFTLPHTILVYIRAKSVNVRRSTYVYIFTIYFLCAYFMTMLPLPSMESFENMRPIKELVQLIPFKNFFDIKAESFIHDVLILVFNLILTVPLGFFMRFLYRFGLKKTALIGFLTATLYEVTQITGIFFIYPRPYRIFDIDDFIINTLGAVIGYLLVPLVSKLLPSPDESERQLVQGSEVSFFQRSAATLIDWTAVFAIVSAVILGIAPLRGFIAECNYLLRFPVFFVFYIVVGCVYSFIPGKGTLGTRITGLSLKTKGGKDASRIKCSLRFLLMTSSVIAIPFWVYFFMTVNTEYTGASSIIWVFIGTALMMCAAAVLLEMMFNAVTHGSSMFYDRISGTYVAYGSSRKTSLFGIRVIDIKTLTSENVDLLSQQVSNTLLHMNIPRKSVTCVRLMAEGIMLDWIENGLENIPCELRLDKRYKRKTLMLSVPGEDKTKEETSNKYAEMLAGLGLTVKTYYAGEKNICNILLP